MAESRLGGSPEPSAARNVAGAAPSPPSGPAPDLPGGPGPTGPPKPTRGARRRSIVAVAAGGLVVAGLLVWHWWPRPADGWLRAAGTIEATEIRVAFRIGGRVVERPADEGARLPAGALVARLETPELDAEVDRLRATLEATQTRLPQLRTEIEWREELTRRHVAEAEAVLAARQARLAELRAGSRPQEIAGTEAVLEARQARLAELRAGSRPQDIEKAEAEAREADALLQNARAEFRRVDRLAREGLVAEQSRDAARTALDVAAERHTQARERLELVKAGARAEEIRRAEADVRQAEAVLALVKEGPRPEVIDQAEADVRQARAVLLRVKEGPRIEEIRRAEADVRQAEAVVRVAATAEMEVMLKRQELETLRANVARDRAALAAAEAQRGYTLLRTPQAGVVLRTHVEPGEVIAAGTPAITLADLESVWLKIYIPEPQLGWIKLGQPAEITTDSYPGKIYSGTVTFISSEAEFTPKTVQTQEERIKLVFAVKINVGNPDQELKPGMPADARVRLP